MSREADEIRSVIISAVGDEHTCDLCAEQDGDEYEYGEPTLPVLPHAGCTSSKECRCIYIYVMKSESPAR